MSHENHGVKLGRRPEDYMAGAFTFISYEERNPSGDWRPYLPTKEIQYGKEDSMSCVSFSAINAIEMQEKFLTGKETNYSDRWIAKMSGTTIEGNYLYKVADTIRKYGLVKEASYFPPSQYTFAEFHADIPPAKKAQLEAEGKKWLEEWEFRYEFIPATKEAMMLHIKQSPLQIVIPGHAIVDFLCEEHIVNYFDTYNPHEKITSYGNIQTAMKPLLTLKSMPEPRKYLKINDGGKIYIALLQGFGGTLVAASSMDALAKLEQALGVPADTLTYNYPN